MNPILHTTQVAIIGAGPAGLLLGQLLHKHGIDNIIVERQSGDYVLGRIRAGILEQTTVDLLHEAGVGDGVSKAGYPHSSLSLIFNKQLHTIELPKLAHGRTVTAYGQTEVTRDLMQARQSSGQVSLYNASDVSLNNVTDTRPTVQCVVNGQNTVIQCQFIAGCDGFHGVSRQSIPVAKREEFVYEYPFGWLGVLAEVPPVSPHAIVYGNSENGFSLCSMRSLTRSRYYVQCPISDRVENWSDERFWQRLKISVDEQTASQIITGPSIEKSIAPLRSFISEPMRYGNLFLAGDAAHIVPPTGAKGLNLAASDVRMLSEAFIEYFRSNKEASLEAYSQRALARVWRTSRFSWWLTRLMHRFPDMSTFDQRMQESELAYLMSSPAAQTVLAENYTGLPM
jgi:p-hydroxybenzoate 3-monooxygenase